MKGIWRENDRGEREYYINLRETIGDFFDRFKEALRSLYENLNTNFQEIINAIRKCIDEHLAEEGVISRFLDLISYLIDGHIEDVSAREKEKLEYIKSRLQDYRNSMQSLREEANDILSRITVEDILDISAETLKLISDTKDLLKEIGGYLISPLRYYLARVLRMLDDSLSDEERNKIYELRTTCERLAFLRNILYRILDIISCDTFKILSGSQYISAIDLFKFISSVSGLLAFLKSANIEMLQKITELQGTLQKLEEIKSSLSSIVGTVQEKLTKFTGRFTDYVTSVQLVTSNNGKTIFRMSTASFMWKLLADKIWVMASDISLTSTRRGHKWLVIRNLISGMSEWEKYSLAFTFVEELMCISFSVYIKLLRLYGDSENAKESLINADYVREHFVDLLSDYEVQFLLECMGLHITHPDRELLAKVLANKFEKLMGSREHPVYKFIAGYFFRWIGLDGTGLRPSKHKNMIDTEDKLRQIRKEFSERIWGIAEQILNGAFRGIRPGILNFLRILFHQGSGKEIQLTTFSPTLLKNIAKKMLYLRTTSTMRTIGELVASITLNTLMQTPLAEEEMLIAHVMTRAIKFVWEKRNQIQTINDLIEKLEDLLRRLEKANQQRDKRPYKKMDIEKTINKLKMLREQYGDEALWRVFVAIRDTVNAIEKMLKKLAEGNIEKAKTEHQNIISFMKNVAQTLMRIHGGGIAYISIPHSFEASIDSTSPQRRIIIRIGGFTIVAKIPKETSKGVAEIRAIPLAIYEREYTTPQKGRRERSGISQKSKDILIRGDTTSLATLISILHRNFIKIHNAVKKLFKDAKAPIPTYPAIHWGAHIETNTKGSLKISKRTRTLLTWIALGYSTLEKNSIAYHLLEIAKELKRNKKLTEEDIEILRENHLDKIRSVTQRKGVIWLIRDYIISVLNEIEAFLSNKKKVNDIGERKRIASELEILARRIRNLIDASSDFIRTILDAISGDPIREEERIAKTLKLILEEIGLAPEVIEEIQKNPDEYKAFLDRILRARGLIKKSESETKRCTFRRRIATKLAIAITTLGVLLSKITGTYGWTLHNGEAMDLGINIVFTITLWITFIFMAPIVTRLINRISRKLTNSSGEIMQNILNGFVVSVMTILGMIAMNILLTATAPKEEITIGSKKLYLPNPWRSPLRSIITFEAPAILWILLGAIIIIVSVGGLASLRNPTKLIDRIKGLIAPEEPEERAKKIIMKFGMAMAIIMGIWTYMNTWGIDLFGNMPSGILLSAVASNFALVWTRFVQPNQHGLVRHQEL